MILIDHFVDMYALKIKIKNMLTPRGYILNEHYRLAWSDTACYFIPAAGYEYLDTLISLMYTTNDKN